MVGTLLAAATGVVGASVTAMGVISMPVMLRHGYSKSLSSGVICASGTLGQIIPPSIVLVVLADQLGISVGDLFMGALVPGLMLAGGYALYVFGVAFFRPDVAPAIDPETFSDSDTSLLWSVLSVLMPPLILIITVLGSIFAGIATPTEAGALGAVGALILAILNRRFSKAAFVDAVDETVKLTSMIVFLLVGSTAFALVFRGLYGHIWIESVLQNLPGGALGLLIFANIIVFILGFFIDFFEIAFIILPILLPVAKLLGIDLVWFGVLLGINLQTSFLTPPFGFSLFYLRGVVGKEVQTKDIYRGVIPFIGIQAIVLLIVFFFPELLRIFEPKVLAP
jgi:tripartite ATP-independent transporter DctM subunit